jgi:hypothetical protein
MSARRAFLCALVGAVLAGAVVAAPAPSAIGEGQQVVGAYFISTCAFSHRAPDDPIVFPGHRGWSHDHTFVGDVSTNALSTVESLRKAGTTCQRKADTAAYWAPTLLAGNRPVTPLGATLYYNRTTKAAPTAFPAGLKMVAGNSLAARSQSYDVTYWQCIVPKTNFNYQRMTFGSSSARRADGAARYGAIPECGRSANLELRVNFPDCWNGRSVDSRNHKSHMAYSVKGACPKRHPVAVPALSLVYRYPSTGSARLMLSSGGQLTGHADFFNAWRQSTLERLVKRCLVERRACGLATP